MSLYPDIQKKAQEEVDRVVGPRRLPNFEDYDRLVYVKAIILETLRWLPVLPMGVQVDAVSFKTPDTIKNSVKAMSTQLLRSTLKSNSKSSTLAQHHIIVKVLVHATLF